MSRPRDLAPPKDTSHLIPAMTMPTHEEQTRVISAAKPSAKTVAGIPATGNPRLDKISDAFLETAPEGTTREKIVAADDEARRACWARNTCQAHGVGFPCEGRLLWGHIVSRQVGPVRWHPLNCLCLCARHEAFFTKHEGQIERHAEALLPGRMRFLNEYAKTNRTDPERWISHYRKSAARQAAARTGRGT